MELTPDQKREYERALVVSRVVESDDWATVELEGQLFSKGLLGEAEGDPAQTAFKAGGAKAILDFIDHLKDIPHKRDAMLKELSQREAGSKAPKSSMRPGRSEPSDLQ